jgi:hypothetical protein
MLTRVGADLVGPCWTIEVWSAHGPGPTKSAPSRCSIWSRSVPKPYKFIGFGGIHGPKPYKFIGFGGIHGPKPYTCIWSRSVPFWSLSWFKGEFWLSGPAGSGFDSAPDWFPMGSCGLLRPRSSRRRPQQPIGYRIEATSSLCPSCLLCLLSLPLLRLLGPIWAYGRIIKKAYT